MIKKFLTVLFLVSALLTTLALASCDNALEDDLVGLWLMTNENDTAGEFDSLQHGNTMSWKLFYDDPHFSGYVTRTFTRIDENYVFPAPNSPEMITALASQWYRDDFFEALSYVQETPESFPNFKPEPTLNIGVWVEGEALVFTQTIQSQLTEQDFESMFRRADFAANDTVNTLQKTLNKPNLTIVWRVINADGEVLAENEYDGTYYFESIN